MSYLRKKTAIIRIGALMLLAAGIFLVQQSGVFTTHAATVQYVQVPLVSQEALNNGHTGGEGAQWIRSGMGFSPVDTNFAMFSTDVGGVYRSLDGGLSWQLSSNGWDARGGTNFAFDPHNANRVLGVGGNSLDDPSNNKPNGVYLSTDKGASWSHVLPQGEGPEWRTTTIAYDPSSYNASLGYTTVAYYITKNNGLYKTTDGGQTWSKINSQFTGYNGFRIAVHPTKGYVYVVSNENPDYGTANGFYKSTDGGTTFVKKADGYTLGLDVSASAPDKVFISSWSRVSASTDAGETFQTLTNQGLPTDYTHPLENVTVSPSDANYMSVWWGGDNYDWRRYYTKDGGQTWGLSNYGDGYGGTAKGVKNSIIPYNPRNGVWAYNPSNPNIVLSTGGDWVSRSTDGGATYQWSNDGYNAIFAGPFNFNSNSPNTMVITSKDYSAFTTTNGGQSWKWAQLSFDWGGYTFAGMALDSNVMWLAEDERIDSQGPAFLKVSTDGGQTWSKKQYGGADIEASPSGNKFDLVSYVDPTNNDIGFIGKWRTTDHANSWAPMSGVEQVYTSNPTGSKELYGRNGNDIVKSTDHGASWTSVATVSNGFRDLAYDFSNNRFWVVSEDQLKLVANGQVTTTSNLPVDQYNTVRVKTVAVDPVDSNIVYVGNNRDLWASSNSLVRSTNGGQSWENLTAGTNGPREVWWVRVNPQTRDVWMETSCYGIWKIPGPGSPPASGSGLQAEYYNSQDLSGSVALSQADSQVNFDWGNGSPGSGVNSDHFSARWTGQVQATTSGNYTFSTVSDDGVRLWVNNQLVIDNWTDHAPTTNNSGAIALTGGQKYAIKMEYYENSGGAVAKLLWTSPGGSQQAIPQSQLFTSGGGGLKGDYFNNATLSNPVTVSRTDSQVNFDWGTGSPASGIGSDNFSVRWTGQVQATTSGNYSFSTTSDDGIRLWVNNQLVIDNWTDHAPTTNNSGAISLTGGQKYAIKLEFYERGGGAVAKLLWTPPGGSQQAIPQSQLFAS